MGVGQGKSRRLSYWVKKLVSLFLLIFLLDIGISVYLLLYDLKTRFPDIDFSKSRFGVASWYSRDDKNINEHTANGEKFNDTQKTCASWDYPFGTRLLVINPLNGKWVVCRVNDRGPAKYLNRQVDLTKSAFKKIADLRYGLRYVTFLPVSAEK